MRRGVPLPESTRVKIVAAYRQMDLKAVPRLPPNTIGGRIQRLRQHLGMTRRDLAAKCGKPEGSIADTENGRFQPNATTVTLIAAALDVPASLLINGEIIVATPAESKIITRPAMRYPVPPGGYRSAATRGPAPWPPGNDGKTAAW